MLRVLLEEAGRSFAGGGGGAGEGGAWEGSEDASPARAGYRPAMRELPAAPMPGRKYRRPCRTGDAGIDTAGSRRM